MSLVDYAAAARKRVPRLPGIPWQPGLWLAWAVIVLAAFAAFAPGLLTHYSPIEGIAGAQRLAPQAGHWLGTDQLGRDVYTRIIYGASHSLSAALAAVTMGLVVGTGLGVIAGAFAGRVESLLMRFVDVLLSIPSLLLSLTVIILLGFGTVNAAIAVGVASIASFARLARGEVVRIRHTDYVEAAFGSGGISGRAVATHSSQFAHCCAGICHLAVWPGHSGALYAEFSRLWHATARPGMGITDR
jgi:peptide/nickel transport system permease protein